MYLFLKIHEFYLLLLKTRTCTEYTVKVVSYNIPIILPVGINLQGTEDGRTAPGVCGSSSVPLSHSGNDVTRIGIHTHILQRNILSMINAI